MPQANKPKFIKTLIVTALVLFLVCVGFSKVKAITHSSFSPADGGNATASQNITVTMSETFYWSGSGYVTIYNNGGSTFEQYYISGSDTSNVSGSGTSTLTINPTTSFTTGNSYYVNIDNWMMIDGSWMTYYSGISDNTTWNFTVADTTKPSISTLTPADGAVKVLTGMNLTIVFDEAIDIRTGNVTIKNASGNTTLETIAVNSAKVTGNGTTTIVINPANGLTAGANLYVQIDNGAFYDLNGNDFDGISDTTTWNFSTWDGTVNWYNASWAYRMKVKVLHSKVNGDLADFPVMVNLNDLGASFFSHVKSDGTDIVVTNFTGNGTKLARELESINTSAQTGILWFKAADLYNAVNGDFYIYYGYNSASETNSTSTWKSNYQVVSHFTETPTASDVDSEFQDSTSNNKDGKSKGSMGSGNKVAGQIGNGISLDGSNDYFDYGNISAIDSKPKASFSLWFKRANTYSSMPLFNKGSSTSVIDIYENTTTYRLTEDDINNYHTVNVTPNTNWHYMVAVLDGTASGNSNRFKFYVDGAAQSLSYANVGSGTGGESASLYVGYRYDSMNWPYSFYAGATYDELHISNGTFSAAWIKTEYDNQNSPSTFYTVSAEEAGAGDTDPPTVSSYSPADGATGVSATANLVITFNEAIDIHTGNLYIRKTSDDTTAETISVASGQVTGNGTTSITINPSITLADSTSYYVNFDSGAFTDTAGNNYGALTANGTWDFTTAAPPGGWWNADWLYREKITIENSKVNGSTALTNFPIYVNLNHLSSHFFDYVNSDGSDIRITDNLGNLMAREVAYINTTNNAGELFFIANGSLSATVNADYYLYYANPTATEPTANGAYAKESVWKANYVGVWHFTKDPWYYGAADSTSNNRDCTQSGNMDANDLVTGQVNYALDFDGSNDYVTCGTSINTALQSQANMTFSGWFKRRSSSNYIVTGAYYSGGYQLGTYTTDGNVKSHVGTGTYGYNASNDTNWHYLNWLYDGGQASNSTRLKLYYDGTATTMSYSGTIPATTYSNYDAAFRIGTMGSTGVYTNGYWDEVRVSSVTRSNDWAKTEYNNLNSPSTFYRITNYETATDTKAPTVVSVTPTDGSTGVRYNTSLTIVFSEYIDTQSGNITIKKSSDNSTVETIAANAASVTGNGTTTLTINISDLSGNNGYYLNIASGAIKDLAGNSYTGIADSTTWNFTTETIGNWYNGDWLRRVKITVNANYVNGDLSNFPVYVNLNGLNATAFFDYINSDGSDIRVTKIDGTTLVAREVAYINATSNAGELYFVANGTLSGTYNGSYYIYYANPTATEPAANGTYAKESVWANNYVGVWHFNQNPWTQGAYDSTSNNYDCTQSGNMDVNDLVSGKVNYALDFDGSNDYLTCGTAINTALQSKANMTFSGWFKRRSSSNYIVTGAYYSGGYQLGTYTTDGNVKSHVGTGTYGYNSSNDTNWHYLNWHYTGGQTGNNAEALKLYFDGVATAMTYSGTIPATTYSNYDAAFRIGTMGSTGVYTNGYWDEVRFATAARSGDWAVTEYNNLNSPNTFIRFSSIETASDSKAPTLVSVTPTDGSTGVRYNTSLTMVFSEFVDTQSGNITIKKSSDNTTVQTITANSASVTGNGTTTLTVDISDLSGNNGYYLNIASGAIKDLAGNSYTGIADSTTWNFTTETLGNWYNGDWLYRVKVTVNANYVNGDLSNFPVYVNLNGLNATAFFDYINSDGSDIRVTKIDGTTLVAREVAYINATSNAGELYFVANGTLSGTYNGSYYIYYANPTATEPAANGTYAKESVWANNYVGVWHFNQNPWTQGAYDSTSNNYNCTQSGNMDVNDLVSGKVNYAIDFDGSNDYLTCGTTINTALQSKANMTFSGWFKRRSSSNYIVTGAYYSGGYQLGTYTTDGNVKSHVGTGTYGYNSSNDTNWHYLNWLYAGGQTGNNAEALKLYFDGAATTMTYSGTIPATTYSNYDAAFRIGTMGSTGVYTNGYWDEVRFATAARSGDWAVTEYNNLNSPNTFIRFSSIETASDSKAPTLVSVTPTDNATGVKYNTDLTMVFSEYVDTQSGNITIKKSSDNSTVQTIAANSASVTGNGTTTLTVNINDLSGNNGYYLNIASGAIKDLAGNSYAGIATTTTWNFTTETVGNWYNGNWLYRVRVYIEQGKVNGDLSNFPIYLNLSSFSSKNLFNLSKSDGTDIRMTKIDGTTEVAREIAYYDSTNNAGELYFVANGTLSGTYNGSYYMYFGNAGASEPTANGTYAKESVWVNSYVGVWHFTADPSVSNKDSTSNNRDCTQSGSMNSADLVTGQVNYALDFDGSNDYLDCGSGINTALQSQANMTFSGWFKRRSSSNYIVTGAYYSGGYQLGTYTTDGNVKSHVGTGTYGYNSSNDTNWHYLNWLYAGGQTGNNAEALKLYFDGAATTMTYSGTIPATTYSNYDASFRIGTMGSTGVYTNGYWDEVRFATAARSNDWAVTEYNNLSSPSTFYRLGARESSIADVTNPSVLTYSPTDGATGVSNTANLVLTFDEYVTVQTGNITIKRSSNGSTFETIAVTDPTVTGDGTDTITINPVGTLADNTSYYINIDATAFDDTSGNSYAGISNSTTWNFTTGCTNIAGWYDCNWGYRKKLTVQATKVNGDLADFPVMVDLANLGSSFMSHVKSDGTDIVVTGSTGNGTKLARELESINTSANTGVLWFKAANLYNASNVDFYIYYGNSTASETNSTSTWKSSYQTVSHFTETPTASDADSEFQDSTSNNKDAKSKGTMGASDKVAGQIGNGVYLDGTSNYLDYGNITAIDTKPKASFSTWFKRANTSSTLPMFNKGSSYSVIDLYENTTTYRLSEDDLSNYHTLSVTPNTNWHYMVSVFNGTGSGDSGRFKFYIDGAAQSLSYSHVGGNTGGESASLYVGYRYDSNNWPYSYYAGATFDEVHISNGAYSAAWIKTEYDNQYSPSTFYSLAAEESFGPDTTAPTVSSFSPTDGNAAVSKTSNLVIVFSESVVVVTGNVTIKKSSDNSTVQTIDITSGAVTGTGTTTITINPPSDLATGTAYYINIDATAIDDSSGNSYAGISNTTTWNFTTTGGSNAIFFDMSF